MSFLQRTAVLVGRSALVGLPALLPLVPPLVRGELDTPTGWLAHLSIAAVLVAAFYLNTRVGLTRLLFRGRAGAYALFLLVLTASTLALGTAAGRVAHRAPRPAPRREARPTAAAAAVDPATAAAPRRARGSHDFEMVLFLSAVVALGAGTLAEVNRRARTETERRRQAETQNLEVELAYLRAQLNPHVFFNTLNSIYVLADLNLPQAKQALIRLSRLMRYLLYQTHEARVPLSQEITFLEDYIALMKLRLTPNMQVEFERPDAPGHQLLAPMLLQPFVENAFKYGLSTTQPSAIFIGLAQSDANQTLTLEVRNRVFAVPQTGFDTGSGIGLANTRRRLELLYPGRHTLALTERNEAGEFVVHLTLHLA